MVVPPSTAAKQRRNGYLSVGAATVVAIALVARNVYLAEPWTHFVEVYLLVGTLIVLGIVAIVDSRRKTDQQIEREQHLIYTAGYYSFVITGLVLVSNIVFDPAGGLSETGYFWTGLLTFFGVLLFLRFRSDG